MTRRIFFMLLVLCGAGVGAMSCWRHPGHIIPSGGEDPEGDRRVRFICCEEESDYESYSPAIYLRLGGGRGAFDLIREAAPFFSPDDAGASAAGFCGFLFQKYRYDGDPGGTMSLDPLPQPSANGKIDWEAYGGDGDIIIINVHLKTAKCCFGTMEGQEIRDLPLGQKKAD